MRSIRVDGSSLPWSAHHLHWHRSCSRTVPYSGSALPALDPQNGRCPPRFRLILHECLFPSPQTPVRRLSVVQLLLRTCPARIPLRSISSSIPLLSCFSFTLSLRFAFLHMCASLCAAIEFFAFLLFKSIYAPDCAAL